MKINGNLIFHTPSGAATDGQIKNAIIERHVGGTGLETMPTGVAGRIIYNTSTDKYYYHNGSSWQEFGTGGSLSNLQTEVDAIETAMGSMINNSGNYVAFSGSSFMDGASDVTGALSALDAAIAASNELGELTDVVDGAGYAANVYGLLGNGTNSYSLSTISLGNLSNVADGVDAAATDSVLAFDGTEWTAITAATFGGDMVLGDISDVTITTVADNDILQYNTATTDWENVAIGSASGIQAYDAALDALSALASTGIVVQTAADTFVTRTIVEAPDGAALSISNGDGVAGAPTIEVDDALDSIASLTNAAGQILYTTGTDTFANSSITAAGLAILDDADAAAQRTTLGLVAGGAGDIWVEKAGDTMDSAANLTFVGGGTVTGIPNPTNDTDAASKAYVDSLTAGLSWKDAVRVATSANVVIAGDTQGAAYTIDGVALASGDRVLVRAQTASAENGIYTVTISTTTNPDDTATFTRATDMDAAGEFDGAAVFVQEGTTHESTGWTETATVATVGTDAVVFSQFSGGSTYTWGVGLADSGNTVNINLGAGIAELPSDEVGVDLFGSGALILTTDGSTSSTATGAALYLKIDGTNLSQSASGLKIANGTSGQILVADASGVFAAVSASDDIAVSATGAMTIQPSAVTMDMIVEGTSGQIIVANATDGSPAYVTMSGDATIAADGALTINATSVENSMLVNSTIGTAGDSGTDTVALGETLNFTGGTGITTAVNDNVVTITRDAMAASDLTDVTSSGNTAGEILVNNGSGYVNDKIFYVETIDAAATTWIIVHSLGQKFVNVTVYDSSDQVIIPESITATDATTTTITFNTAITGTAVITGVPGVAAV